MSQDQANQAAGPHEDSLSRDWEDGFPIPGWLWRGALLVLVAIVAYSPMRQNGFIWDDDSYVTGNLQLLTSQGLYRIWTSLEAEPQYYPLTHTTFWLERRVWGVDAAGYHFDNLMLHIAAALLLWRLLLRLEIPGAFAAAMIWAVHPVMVESVAWAAERKNVLSGVFYFLSLWAYLHTRWGRWITNAEEEANDNDWGWYVVSVLFFIAALLSKSVTSSLPAVVLVLAWWKRGTIRAKDLLPLIPMFALGIAMGILTAHLERVQVGALGPGFDELTALSRVCIAGHAIWFYLGKIFWPHPLAFFYPRWVIDPASRPWQLLWPAAAVSGLIGLWLARNKIRRGPAAAAFFFAGTLVPALGFTNVYPMRFSFVADHFQYMACIGPIVLCAALGRKWLPEAAGILAMFVVMLILIGTTLQRVGVYKNLLTLWKDLLLNNNSAMAHSQYGRALLQSGDTSEALTEFQTARNMGGGDWKNKIDMGDCYAKRGDWATALKWYTDARDQLPQTTGRTMNHSTYLAWSDMGRAYLRLSESAGPKPGSTTRADYLARSLQCLKKAQEIDPFTPDIPMNMGVVLEDSGRLAEAADQFRAAIKLSPDFFAPYDDLGQVLGFLSQNDDAVAAFNQALSINGNDIVALNGICSARYHQNRYEEALDAGERALQLDPPFQVTLNNVAVVKAAMARAATRASGAH